jgi:diguanylate cyclase with GGDEF domain
VPGTWRAVAIGPLAGALRAAPHRTIGERLADAGTPQSWSADDPAAPGALAGLRRAGAQALAAFALGAEPAARGLLIGASSAHDTRNPGDLRLLAQLAEAAAALERADRIGALRRGYALFRIGGDAFAALVAISRDDEAHEAAARLRRAVADAWLGVTISVGVAVGGTDEADASVLERADRALYAVRARGRDGVAVAP